MCIRDRIIPDGGYGPQYLVNLFSQKIAACESIVPEQVVAIGDGANDVQMLAIAGLGIAFNAKPVLQERASGQLNQPNLDALLYFLGLSGQELADC